MSAVDLALGFLAVACAVLTIFAVNASLSALLLWVVGLAVGGLFLSQGAELLAIMQWVVSTVMAVSFMFFSLLFGEYWGVTEERLSRKIARAAPALALGVVFTGILWLGVKDLIPTPVQPTPAAEGPSMAAIGKAMAGRYLLTFEVFVGAMFCVLVGAAVVARPDREDAP